MSAARLYDPEPPDDYPWGLEELFGLLVGAGAAALSAVIWFRKRYWRG